MTQATRLVRAIAALALVTAGLAACGGSTGQSATSAVNQPAGGAAGASATTLPSVETGGGDTQAPAVAGNAPDPCSLITDAEAATVFGGPVKHVVGDSRDASNGNGVVVTENRCEYDEVTSSQLGYDLWVAVFSGADRAYFDDVSNSTDAPPIAGLGDAAKGASGDIYVISKGTVLEFYGSLPSADGLSKAATVAIAKR